MTTIVLTLTIVRSLMVTDADLVPGALVTVWWDDACDCRRVEVTRLDGDDGTNAIAEAP